MNYKIETGAGDMFSRVAEKAKSLAVDKGFNVEFEFNGIICIVNHQTNLDNLYRDYCIALLMNWETVGPNCPAAYEPGVQAEFERRSTEIDERRAREQAMHEAAEQKKKEQLEEKIKGIEVEWIDPVVYQNWKDKNTDPYSAVIFTFAEQWAKLMQVSIAAGASIERCADNLVGQADTVGLSGYQYGAAVSVLSQCWKHGEDLRKWHNKQYNHEGEGTVNPAVLTIT